MTESQALYLFKAARRPLYRKENLHLLAAERGSIIEVAYNRSWVAPEYFDEGSIPRGAVAYFIFTDRPYALYVPVREAEIVDARYEDVMLRIRVLLKSWVRYEDGRLEDFTRAVRRVAPGRVPGQKFLSPKRDDARLLPCFDEREDEGWRGAVDNVLRMSRATEGDPYQRTVFFRPAGLRVDGGETLAARGTPLEPGQRAALLLRFHNPHLTEGDTAGLALRVLAPPGSLTVLAPEQFPLMGDLELELEARPGEIDPTLTVQIAPAPALHTIISERFVVRGGAAPPQPATRPADAAGHASIPLGPGPAGGELLRLYDAVVRNARFEQPADELDVLDAFERVLHGEPRIAERRGLLHWQRGEEAAAHRILRGLDPETLGDDARFVLFRLSLQREGDAPPAQLVETLDLAGEGRFPRLLEELERIEPRHLARIVPELVGLIADREQLVEIMSHAATRIEQPEALSDTARNLYFATNDSGWAFDFLLDRYRALRLASPVVERMLIDLAEAGGRGDHGAELAELAGRHIANLIAQDQLDEARGRLRKTGEALGREERNRLYHRVADRLLGQGQHGAAAEALIELAYAALATGDLDEATEAVERARSVWALVPSNAPAPEWLLGALERVEAAWRECEEVAEWRKSSEDLLRERLRSRFLNKKILIAGGLRREEWVRRLEALTGASVEWAVAFRGEVDDLAAFAQRIRNGQYALVVHLVQKSGHEVGDRLKAACDAAGVTWVAARGAGVRGVVEGIVSVQS